LKIYHYRNRAYDPASAQLYHALKDKYGRLAGRFAKCLCKLNMTYPSLRQVGDDASGFFEQAGMDSLGRETIRMEAEASLFGSYMQNEVVSEAKWALAAFIGGKVAGKALDAIDDCIDARRLGKAAGNVDDLASAKQHIIPKGGTYTLRVPKTGDVMRTGRTKDLLRRRAQHLRDPLLKDYRFDVVHRTDIYEQQRGLEQLLHEAYRPPLNEINPISPRNPMKQKYMEAAKEYLK
jgi:hypothetical protein